MLTKAATTMFAQPIEFSDPIIRLIHEITDGHMSVVIEDLILVQGISRPDRRPLGETQVTTQENANLWTGEALRQALTSSHSGLSDSVFRLDQAVII